MRTCFSSATLLDPLRDATGKLGCEELAFPPTLSRCAALAQQTASWRSEHRLRTNTSRLGSHLHPAWLRQAQASAMQQ